MSRSIQLVLLCVVTLSYIQLGRAESDGKFKLTVHVLVYMYIRMCSSGIE